MVETAAVAGDSVGGGAGKKVSDSLTSIFEKVDKSTAKAAKSGETKASSSARSSSSSTHGASTHAASSPTRQGGETTGANADANAPLLDVGPGVPRADGSNVPPPPPLRRASVRKTVPAQELPPPPIAPPPAPAPPQITADDLKQVTAGMQRNDVLRLGEPTSRISMVDEGHLLEIYRYQSSDTTLGVVRLTDGAVSTVLIR